MLTHASLFSGIGGFDLAAEWAGWENIFHCEWNPFGQKVLAHHFPNSKSYHDITKTDFSIHNGTVDVLTGGFPCQPYSSAGKRLGKADERHLFPEMLRAIKEIKPKWVVGENVRGLVSWNDGLVFNEVYNDLESEGYEVQSFLIPAAGVNAPHQRYRIWFVAYSKNCRCGRGDCKKCSTRERELFSNEQRWGKMGSKIEGCSGKWDATDSKYNKIEHSNNGSSSKEERILRWGKESNVSNSCNSDDVTNATSIGLERECGSFEKLEREIGFSSTSTRNMPNRTWQNFPTQSPICGGDDGLPKELDGITFPKWRNESIKAYGNAIVPQVAFEIFKAINEFELLVNK